MTDSLELDRTTDTVTIEIPTTPSEIDLSPSMPITTISSEVATLDAPDWLKQTTKIVAELPSYLGQIYQENKGIVTILGLFFGAIVALKLVFALLFAVNEIPLLAPTFELVGIGYTTWFVWRYLLQAAARDELAGEINDLKSEILGNPDPS